MKVFFLPFMIMIVLSCAPSPQKKKDQVETDKIRSVREFSNQSIERKDTAALASVWTIDYHVITSRNFEVSGRAANRDRFFNEFSSKPDVIYIRTPQSIEVFDKWNMASETGTWVGRWTDMDVHVEVTGTYFAIWHHVDGTWLIRAELFVPLACSGSTLCDQSPIQ